MRWFDPEGPSRSARHSRVYAAYELAHTAVDFAAAMMFVVGSVLFLFEEWMRVGTWCFLAGSICFALKPTLRFAREVTLLRLGRTESLAARLDED